MCIYISSKTLRVVTLAILPEEARVYNMVMLTYAVLTFITSTSNAIIQ